MKRYFVLPMFLFVAGVWAANVHAQQEAKTQGTGFYFGGQFGVNILSDADFIQTGLALGTNYDTGLSLGGGLGYDFGSVRVDGEIAFRNNIITDISGIPTQGNASALSYMVNGYFDFPVSGPVNAYIGSGIGFATVFYDVVALGSKLADDRDLVLAYQFSGGIGYEVNPRTTVTFGYRYFATEDPEIETLGGLPLTTEYQSHEFNVGIRILFN